MRAGIVCTVLLTVGLAGADQRGIRRGEGIPEGQAAFDFTLKHLKSDKTFKLSSNFGKLPTVLIFGSYT